MGCLTKVEELGLPYYLPIDEGEKIWFHNFPKDISM